MSIQNEKLINEELIKEIKELQAPESGTMYAVYQTHIEYKTYNSLQDIIDRENWTDGLLELHLFDEKKEYRYIQKRKGFISKIIDDSKNNFSYDDIYEEHIYVMESKRQVAVVNYITFDEDDLLHIDNYRLKEVGING